MQIFDIVNPDLFRPLTGCNRREYADVLSLLWNLCKREPVYGMERSTIVEEIENYFSGIGEIEEVDFMEDIDRIPEEVKMEEWDKKDARKMANAFLRRLKKTGWLEEKDGDYAEESVIQIKYQVIPLIKSFDETVTPQIVTYQGKLFKIYTLLLHIGEQKHPYETILKEISADMGILIESLRQMAASISVYMENLTKGKTPQEVLDFFNHYEEKIVAGAYHRFKTQDNFFYYRSEIDEKLEECFSLYSAPLIKDCMQTEDCDALMAEKKIKEMMEELRENLYEILHVMKVIDDRHLRYRTRAVQRAQFLLTADGSMRSKTIHLLRYYASEIKEKHQMSEPDDTKASGVFQIYGQGYFSPESLYTPVSKRERKEIPALEFMGEINDFFLEEEQEKLYRFASGALTLENVNHFAKEVLGQKAVVSASGILKDRPWEMTKIIGLHTYSRSRERIYELTLLDEFVEMSGVCFYDFEIRRKEMGTENGGTAS